MRASSKILFLAILTGFFTSLLHETLVDSDGGRTGSAQQTIVHLLALPPAQPPILPSNRNCNASDPVKRGTGCATSKARRGEILLAGALPLPSGSTETGRAMSAHPTAFLKEIELTRAVSVGLAAGPAPVAHSGRSYVVLGSFAKRGNAENVVNTHRAWNPKIVAVKIQGRVHDRVLIGPYPKQELDLVLRRVGAAGIEAPWPLAEKLEFPVSFAKLR